MRITPADELAQNDVVTPSADVDKYAEIAASFEDTQIDG